MSSVFECCMINLINKLFYFCDYKLNGVDLPKAFLLRSWKGLYYWNVFGGSVDWVYAFQVRGNQSLSDHLIWCIRLARNKVELTMT